MGYDSVESDTQQRNDRRPAYQPTAATLATTDAQRDYPTVAPLGKGRHHAGRPHGRTSWYLADRRPTCQPHGCRAGKMTDALRDCPTADPLGSALRVQSMGYGTVDSDTLRVPNALLDKSCYGCVFRILDSF